MKIVNAVSVACVAVAAAAAVLPVPSACAEFATGNSVLIQGIAGPELGYTYWGTNITGTPYVLGSVMQPYHGTAIPADVVYVSSLVTSPTSVTFSFMFSQFRPGLFSLHALEIIGLKSDGSLISVSASQGTAIIEDGGNKIRWDGTGAGLTAEPKLLLTIEQSPAPGALALLGLAGIAGGRRRRG